MESDSELYKLVSECCFIPATNDAVDLNLEIPEDRSTVEGQMLLEWPKFTELKKCKQNVRNKK